MDWFESVYYEYEFKVLDVAKTETTLWIRLPKGKLYTETLYTTPQQELIKPFIDESTNP